ncbi:hypothetical protein [Hymenobacter koreensis]|uniref:Uncharacterized protein n=1 Tax=Hymenobacter koreensis TaxID=1084523 RepID=A0ABP8JN31_9BACT
MPLTESEIEALRLTRTANEEYILHLDDMADRESAKVRAKGSVSPDFSLPNALRGVVEHMREVNEDIDELLEHYADR